MGWMTSSFTDSAVSILLRIWLYLVPLGQRLIPYAPERLTRDAIARALQPHPRLWGWSDQGERRHAARCSYRDAFPAANADDFIAETITTRARCLATGMTYAARVQAGRRSRLVHPLVVNKDKGPFIVAHLHYAIDPVVQLSLLSAYEDRRLRWAVYPAQPRGAPRWEGERSLLLAGRMPAALSEALLYVSEPGWLIEALRHLRGGGGLLIALDSLLDARRSAETFLEVG